MIKQREITNGLVYSPCDLFKTYLIFEQTELSDNKYSKINKIQSGVDFKKAFPMIQKRHSKKYWKGRGSGRGAASSSGGGKHQVRQLSY